MQPVREARRSLAARDAFTVLPPVSPSRPQPLRLAPHRTAPTRHRKASFVILAERPALPPRDPSPAGRVSPHRGRGFVPPPPRPASASRIPRRASLNRPQDRRPSVRRRPPAPTNKSTASANKSTAPGDKSTASANKSTAPGDKSTTSANKSTTSANKSTAPGDKSSAASKSIKNTAAARSDKNTGAADKSGDGGGDVQPADGGAQDDTEEGQQDGVESGGGGSRESQHGSADSRRTGGGSATPEERRRRQQVTSPSRIPRAVRSPPHRSPLSSRPASPAPPPAAPPDSCVLVPPTMASAPCTTTAGAQASSVLATTTSPSSAPRQPASVVATPELSLALVASSTTAPSLQLAAVEPVPQQPTPEVLPPQAASTGQTTASISTVSAGQSTTLTGQSNAAPTGHSVGPTTTTPASHTGTVLAGQTTTAASKQPAGQTTVSVTKTTAAPTGQTAVPTGQTTAPSGQNAASTGQTTTAASKQHAVQTTVSVTKTTAAPTGQTAVTTGQTTALSGQNAASTGQTTSCAGEPGVGGGEDGGGPGARSGPARKKVECKPTAKVHGRVSPRGKPAMKRPPEVAEELFVKEDADPETLAKEAGLAKEAVTETLVKEEAELDTQSANYVTAASGVQTEAAHSNGSDRHSVKQQAAECLSSLSCCCHPTSMRCCKPHSNRPASRWLHCCADPPSIKKCCRSLLCLDTGCCRRPACSCCTRRQPAPEVDRRRSIAALSKKQSQASSQLPQEIGPKLDPSLVEHASLIRGAIPVLPVPLAWICLVFNVFVPGLGTLSSGLLCLCFGKPRFSVRDEPQARVGACCLDMIVAVGQMFTILFCLVGWGWSIWWGVIIVKLAKKQRKIKLVEQQQQQGAPINMAVNHEVERV